MLTPVTVGDESVQHGEHRGPDGRSRFGLVVSDLGVVHQRTLDASATEACPPVSELRKPWSWWAPDRGRNRIGPLSRSRTIPAEPGLAEPAVCRNGRPGDGHFIAPTWRVGPGNCQSLVLVFEHRF